MTKKLWYLPLLLASFCVQALPQCDLGVFDIIEYQCSCGDPFQPGVCRAGNGFQYECNDFRVVDCGPDPDCEVGTYSKCIDSATASKQASWSPATSLMPRPSFLRTTVSERRIDCGNPQEFQAWAQMKLRMQNTLANNGQS